MNDDLKSALRLLQEAMQEVDFDEAEGHPPSDAMRDIRERARAVLKDAERVGLINLGPAFVD